MKRLLALAVCLLASNAAAQAQQYQFEYGGRTIRIDPDRGTVTIPGVFDNSNTPRKAKRARTDKQGTPKEAPQEARTEPSPPPADQAAAPAVQPAPAPAPATAATDSTAGSPATDTAAALPPPAPAPQVAPAPAPAPEVAALPPPPPPAPSQGPAAPAPAPVAAAPRDPNSPVGIWLTEEKEGKVRIEQCGGNLCGYSVDAKSNQNGEQVLINMRPGKDQKWSGRILDPNTGSTYDSTIALKGPDTLRVQGCAFGGMFCGGQTWTRVN
ncbi:MAG: DUF2147 domain-containing protein [Bradyrhizobium sp.]|uniref:DUF2147 domain-containing protein n=1 Tax=Bradyrhizobium sp. TaxID=376 RepID=UPI001DF4E87B|nr:DUF2147 domain-containing protein [Bradyrhizobium sp.]MBV9560395.1 DUF2147 domain-containing protein [Bradyrhizobium sp.]